MCIYVFYIYRKCRDVCNIYKICIPQIYYIYHYTFLCIYAFSYTVFLPLGNTITWRCHHTCLLFVPLGAGSADAVRDALALGEEQYEWENHAVAQRWLWFT